MRWTAVLALLGATALAPSASAQIISTSIPEAAAGAPEKNFGFHVFAGYASWDYAALKQEESEDFGFGTPDGILVAADLAFKVNDEVSLGVGGFYNDAPFDATARNFPGVGDLSVADTKSTLFSGYGNVFYKKIGVQVGIVDSKQELIWTEEFQRLWQALFGFRLPNEEFGQTDVNYYLVGRFGGERWSLGIGAGGYQYRPEGFDSEVVASGFINGSVKVIQNLSLDAGVWYIGETDAGDDEAVRLSVGIGYTF